MDGRLAYSVAEVAELLGGISERLVRRQIAEGKIQVFRVGRRVLICADEVEQLLATAEPIAGSHEDQCHD